MTDGMLPLSLFLFLPLHGLPLSPPLSLSLLPSVDRPSTTSPSLPLSLPLSPPLSLTLSLSLLPDVDRSVAVGHLLPSLSSSLFISSLSFFPLSPLLSSPSLPPLPSPPLPSPSLCLLSLFSLLSSLESMANLMHREEQLDELASQGPDTSGPHDHLSQVLGPEHSGRIRCRPTHAPTSYWSEASSSSGTSGAISREDLDAALQRAARAEERASHAEERVSQTQEEMSQTREEMSQTREQMAQMQSMMSAMMSQISSQMPGLDFSSIHALMSGAPAPAPTPAPAPPPAPAPAPPPAAPEDDEIFSDADADF